MNPLGSSVLHDLVAWLREHYTPHPEGWWDVDISEDEEVAAFNDGRPDPSALYTAGELETLAYPARAARLARHRRCVWNTVVWVVVAGTWCSAAVTELVRRPQSWVLLGSGVLVVGGGFQCGRLLVGGRTARRARRGE